jgi:hypothetical protein
VAGPAAIRNEFQATAIACGDKARELLRDACDLFSRKEDAAFPAKGDWQ